MNFTCISCDLKFDGSDAQRSHMRSDWHRYNLKRRVAQLPPVGEEIFTQKIAALTITDHSTEGSNPQNNKTKQKLKRQRLAEIKARKLELLGQKSEVAASDPSRVATNDLSNEGRVSAEASQEPRPELEPTEDEIISGKLRNAVHIPLTTCLFCLTNKSATFSNLEDNLAHMFKCHGLYIPERKYLVDPEGLVKYLGEKLGLGNVCLVCSFQARNLEAVREHMIAKRHMRVPYETVDEKLEISEYYDFRLSYPEMPGEDVGEAPEDEWEDVSNSSEEDSDSDYIAGEAAINTGTELVLPSGIIVGHRSMAKFYKQNLPPEKILSEGHGTVIAAETRHFTKATDKSAFNALKRAWQSQKKREDTNDRRSAKFVNNQPHFRDPLLQ